MRSTKPAGVPCSVGSGQRPYLHGPTPEAGERPHPQGLGERSFGIAVGRASVRATLPTPKGAMPIEISPCEGTLLDQSPRSGSNRGYP